MAYEPKPEMIDQLRIATGAENSEAETAALEQALVITGTKVLNEIRQETMPVMLEPILIEIAADAYRLNKQAVGNGSAGEVLGSVSAITDQGQSVSYRDSSYQTVLSAVSVALRNYTPQLDRFRKVGW